MSDQEAIRQTAEELLDVLSTPIAGIPSVTVMNRKNALRLITASFIAVWEAYLADIDRRAAEERERAYKVCPHCGKRIE